MSCDGKFCEEREVEMDVSASMNAANSAACAAFARGSFEWTTKVSE
jgi:hypothetical protein